MISSFSDGGYLIRGLPHLRSCFFKQPKLDSLLGYDFLQRPSLAAQAFDLIRGRRPRRIPS